MSDNTIKLLDFVALTVNLPDCNLQLGQVSICWQTVQHWKLNSAIVTDELMNL